MLSRLRQDQFDRWKRGERVLVEDVLATSPELANNTDVLIDLIYAEVVLRLETGETPALQEYLDRFPSASDLLQQRWQIFCLIHSGLSPESDPGNRTPGEAATFDTLPHGVPNLTLPGFLIQEKLGEGGMGVVFKARQVDLERTVALKLIRTGPYASNQMLSRFSVEVRAVARMDHPGIIRIYSPGQHDGWFFFCMEYVSGGSLYQRLRGESLAPHESARLIATIAMALQHAHQMGVLHRDLKPGNILLTPEGQPKISDFGLAKLLDIDDGLTISGVPLGTPAYMSPEQALGRMDDLDPRADVYSLGAIFYHCLTGIAPFDGRNRTEILEKVKSESVVGPRQIRPEIPAELEEICLKCLHKKPEHRYGSAADLAADLENWLQGKVRPRPLREKFGQFVRSIQRRPRVTLVGTLLLLAILGTSVFHSVLGREQPPEIPPPEAPLTQIQQELDAGKVVDLIGETGLPRWSRKWKGDAESYLHEGPDGAAVAHGWPLTLIELLPNTAGYVEYVLSADVKHLRSGGAGWVGLYIAGKDHPTTKLPVYSFIHLGFNDITDPLDTFLRLPDFARNKVKKPEGNSVEFKSWFLAPGKEQPVFGLTTGLASPRLVKPAGHKGAPGIWRSLVLRVSTKQIRVEWGGKLVKEMTCEKIESQIQNNLNNQWKQPKPNSALIGLPATPDYRGSLGLVLLESYASFRNVRFTPLKKAPQK